MKVESLLSYMKQYIEEPNAPDYNGEYPPCWEITIEEVELILNYITNLQKQLEAIKFYIEQNDIKNMLWGKEILKMLDNEE